MGKISYYGKTGEDMNYLYVFAPGHTLLILWTDMYNGPEVFTKIKLTGKPKRPKGFKKITADQAAEVLLADILVSQTSMPYRSG